VTAPEGARARSVLHGGWARTLRGAVSSRAPNGALRKRASVSEWSGSPDAREARTRAPLGAPLGSAYRRRARWTTKSRSCPLVAGAVAPAARANPARVNPARGERRGVGRRAVRARGATFTTARASAPARWTRVTTTESDSGRVWAATPLVASTRHASQSRNHRVARHRCRAMWRRVSRALDLSSEVLAALSSLRGAGISVGWGRRRVPSARAAEMWW
jgi:hypothetical protein